MTNNHAWTRVATRAEVEKAGRKIIKADGKQILLLSTDNGLFAFNNRCPHEGYPLSEGSLTEGENQPCTLTCNWHNWKFNLESGETLVGGDKLRHYPIDVREGDIFLDLIDPSPEEQRPELLINIRLAMDDYDYTRIARELARFEKAGLDPKEAVLEAVKKSHDRFEYGMGHAYAASADWMGLLTESTNNETKLTCALEAIAHMAWDSLREPTYPYTEETWDWDAEEYLNAVEKEDDNAAVAYLRGALAAGMTAADLEPTLAEAAFAHYGGFGHGVIYVYKAGSLIEQLGEEATEPVLKALTRILVYQRREDLLPEFRTYADTLLNWTEEGSGSVEPTAFRGLSVRQALTAVSSSTANHQSLFAALMDANAWNFLHFDETYGFHTDLKVTDNVNWLDFTHGITFTNAVRILCEKYPHLWPQALLQMACFSGRNTPYTDGSQDLSTWSVAGRGAFFSTTEDKVLDHGTFEHIISAHLIKLLRASKEEIDAAPDAPWVETLLSGLNRFYHSHFTIRHVKRTVKQARDFVGLED